MKPRWRLLDTGILTAARNMAWDQALACVRGRGRSPNTVRFLQFSPPAALVGAYQVVEEEIRLAYCRQAGIEVNRRLTGGGALLFDETQLGWELIAAAADFPHRPMSQAFHRTVCEACVRGLRRLGLEARFRPRNDIEVNGRKISGTGGFEEGEAFLFQGTLLLDFDPAAMVRALRIPAEKLKQSALDSAADRVTWIGKELGRAPPIAEVKEALVRGFEEVFGVELARGGPLPEEEEEFRRTVPRFESEEWIFGQRRRESRVGLLSGLRRTEAAALRAYLSIDEKRRVLRSTLIAGDYFISPKRAIFDLEARLKDAPLDMAAISAIIEEFWSETRPESPGWGAGDVGAAVEAALGKLDLRPFGFELAEIERIFAVNASPREVLAAKPDLLLLPYCAKDRACALRRDERCVVCGECSFGGVWQAARESGMRPVTILNFEHLTETLRRERERGARAYLGSCCQAFYTKHYADFQRAALPGLLVDVGRATCYDLDQARLAYRGEFEGQTELDGALLLKLIAAAAE